MKWIFKKAVEIFLRNKGLSESILELSRQIEQASSWRRNLAKGIALGVGTAIGASVIAAIVIAVLAKIFQTIGIPFLDK